MIGPVTPEELRIEIERERAARETAPRARQEPGTAPGSEGAEPPSASSSHDEGESPRPEHAEGSQSETGPEGKESAPSGHPLEVPESYRADSCRVMARDPYWIHAYWKISESSEIEAKRELGGVASHRILRVHSQPSEFRRLGDTQPPGFFDIEVGDEPDNWYIHVGIPERTYRVDVGLLAESGLFFPLAVSNRVSTPPDKMSDRVDTKWTSSDAEAADLYEISGGSPVDQISHDPPDSQHPSPRNRETNPRGAPPGDTEPSASAEGGDAPAATLEAGTSINDLGSLDSESDAPSMNGHARTRPGAEGKPGRASRRRQPLGFAGVEGESGADGASQTNEAREAAAAVPTSPHRSQNEGEFWFVLHTEVIVSGATEPDASVTIQGTPVRLRPDGTFSVRFQLPDGVQTIPVVAISPDGSKTRSVIAEVARRTSGHDHDPGAETGPHGVTGGSDVSE